MISYEDAAKKYKNSDPNKKNVFINWDAIEALPEEYEPVFSELTFDPKKLDEYFTNVGSKNQPSWYPQTDVMYKIAEMCGISGETESTVEWISGEVDINPILMKSFDSEPTMRKMIIAARVTKQSKILCEDGTWRLCAPETNEFNFFDRACIDFINEEEKTNEYKSGKKEYYRYNSVIKRRKRLLDLKKFAVQQAETKAFCKTVRVLAGLPTGFDTEDLKDGKFAFMKFIKSKRLQKLETAARLQAISQGKTGDIQNTGALLFGPDQDNQQVDNDTQQTSSPPPPRHSEKNPFTDSELKQEIKPVDEKKKIRDILEEYYNNNEKAISKVSNAKETIYNYISKYEKIEVKKLKEMLKKVENGIPGIVKIEHDIKLTDEEDVF